MKKIKILLVLILTPLLVTGCFKRDSMDNINIYTTVYPIEYLLEQIYGYNSKIDSIYPSGTNVEEYKLTEKKLKEYAHTDLFVYNSKLPNEKQIAASLFNNNSKLKAIDVAKQVSLQRKQEELWLSPSNYLMLAQNIKNELTEYVNATILKQEIATNYDALKITISKYDAELKTVAENATNKTLIVGNDVFFFLEKYGFKIISVEENDNYIANSFQEAKSNIEAKKNSYVFILNTDETSENVKKLESAGAVIAQINAMTNLSDEEKDENLDYPKMMMDFIDQVKTEAYN